jgi:DNA-binding ferritin-like protein
VHQNNHWLTKGANFYSNHLMFDRIYKSASEDSDLAAEKMIGVFGVEALDLDLQAKLIGKALQEFASEDHIDCSLKIEKKFLEFSKKFYDTLKEEDQMTLGLDDLIMSIANNREGACYLLQQTKDEGKQMNSKMAGRLSLLKRIKNAQVVQLNPAELKNKLLARLHAVVPSVVNGTYNERDFNVEVDLAGKKIEANVNLPRQATDEMKNQMETNFSQYALSLIPADQQQGFVIGLGFSFIPKQK